MYYNLGEDIVSVSMFGRDTGNISTIVFQNQTNMQHVLANVGTEIRLYEDYELTTLAAIFNQVEVQRATVDMVGNSISLTISASRLSELETEQMKTDIQTQQSVGMDRDAALVELAEMVSDLMDSVVDLAAQIEELRGEVEAIRPTEPEVL